MTGSADYNDTEIAILEELIELKNSQDKISKFINNRSFKNKQDLKYLKTESEEK